MNPLTATKQDTNGPLETHRISTKNNKGTHTHTHSSFDVHSYINNIKTRLSISHFFRHLYKLGAKIKITYSQGYYLSSASMLCMHLKTHSRCERWPSKIDLH